MKCKIILILVCILLHASITTAASSHDVLQLKLETYNVQSGLPSNEINRIRQDRNGFIWCATNNGLARFDGYEFTSFRSNWQNQSFFSSNTITNICEDSEGNLWLNGPKGVNLFNQHTHQAVSVGDSLLASTNLKATLFMEDGKVLFGGVKGLFIYDRPKGKIYQCSYPVKYGYEQPKNIRTLYKDSIGNIWIGTWKKGVYILMKDSEELIKHESLPKDITVTSFLETSDGNIWMGTWERGLYCISDMYSGQTKISSFTVPANNPHHLDWNIIYDIDIDHKGKIWVGSPGGLRIIDVSDNEPRVCHFECDKENDDLLKEIHSVFCDRDGNMWLSCYGNGIISARYRQSQVKEVNLMDKGLPYSAITAIHKDENGILWLGVRGIGMVCYDPVTNKVINEDNPYIRQINKASNAVVSFVAIPEDKLLFLSTRYDGVFKLSLEGNRIKDMKHFINVPKHRNNLFTNVATKDKEGNIWVGTGSGVVILTKDDSPEGYGLYDPEDINSILKWKAVEAIHIDDKGTVWIGCKEIGLFKMELEGLTLTSSKSYNTKENTINDNKILSLFEDSDSKLWVGTHGGGMSLYNEEKDCFEMVENMQFFPSDEINSITEDSQGNLWIATSNGFVYYDTDIASNEIRSFGSGSDLDNLAFVKHAVFSEKDLIIFGGYNGISMFNSSELLSGNIATSPLIMDVQIFNSSLSSLDDWRKIADQIPPFTQEIKLGHKDKSVNISFTSLCFENNSLVKYAYRLKGLENNWHYVLADQRTVSYNNLNPGKYCFEVKASKNGSQWSETTSIEIIVSQSPWLTAWAIIAYVLFAGGLIAVIIFMLINRLRLNQKLKIEQMERAKSEELNNAKLTFFTNISHELFTPITVMSCSLEKLLEQDSANTSLHRLIRSNLNRLMRLLQQIMEFRKAESSNLKLRVSQTDIVQFVHRICDDNFAPLESPKNVRLIFSSDMDSLQGYIDTDKVDKIVYNFISNAYKYNRQDGRVFVNISLREKDGMRQVLISVKDTGYGISPEKLKNLFKRFYEGDYRRFNTKGTGIGLSLTKDLVDLHHGEISLESTEGEGSVFTVILPIDKGAYPEDQLDGEYGTQLPPQQSIISNESVSTAEGSAAEQNTPDDTEKEYTLLLVEDNEELLFVMKNILSVKYRILTAQNGTDAVSILKQENVNLVISDYVMPGMDGVELTRWIRSDISVSHLPVIMLSARSEVESKLESFEAGADIYVSKPFEVKLLMAQVDGILASRNRILSKFKGSHGVETDSLINTDLDKQFIDKAVRLVEEHLSDPDFNIDAFNAVMNMSNSTLYRKIKGLTGMPPKEFIRNIRFKYACKLLLEKTSSVADVAYMVGFSDAKYFSLSFKKEFGMTPSDYIRSKRKKEE